MGRPSKWEVEAFGGGVGIALRQVERGYKRGLRQAKVRARAREAVMRALGEQTAAEGRARRKIQDKARPVCRCAAYPWPHRPRGGLCRCPDPPAGRWQRRLGSRPYSTRYTGKLREICRRNGVHPIRDRQFLKALNHACGNRATSRPLPALDPS